MSIVNRRNAVLGWLTWTVGKRVLARKAKSVMPKSVLPSSEPVATGGKGRTVKAVAVLAAVAGAVAFWKAKHRDSTDHDSLASEELGGPDT
ncbi:MAG TPA: hypothetical protein VFB35_07625 [Gaiellaceae bacterium]|nr:hypothetical protein [Gaiellaceae bacterium]